jgi:hypothetical protein
VNCISLFIQTKPKAKCQKVLRRIQNPNISKCIGLWFCSKKVRLWVLYFEIIFAVGGADAVDNVAIKFNRYMCHLLIYNCPELPL